MSNVTQAIDHPAIPDPTVTPGQPAYALLDDLADRQLQRRAMLSMWLAMTVMALGAPAHLGSLLGSASVAHPAHGWALAAGWLSWVLASTALWLARTQLARAWRELRRGQIDVAGLVGFTALAAYGVSLVTLVSAGARAGHGAPLYVDVAAMALAWLLAGAAHRSDLRRRFAVTLEQLAPLDASWPTPPLGPTLPAMRLAWLAAVLLGAALLVSGLDLAAGRSVGAALLVGLATLALGCPCTLGIARSSACVAGADHAAAAGWIVVSEAAFWSSDRTCAALRLGSAAPAAFDRIARHVRRAARLNSLWAIGGNLLALPLALRGPVDPLLPAGIMLLAWALIALTNRTIGWRLDVQRVADLP